MDHILDHSNKAMIRTVARSTDFTAAVDGQAYMHKSMLETSVDVKLSCSIINHGKGTADDHRLSRCHDRSLLHGADVKNMLI